ncbi:hypothetical protein F5878DRAFT_725961 [Lentinula raphanica]|uniref:DUF6534 domain-containing protein n=1 Tax=Lentinula raphanica TaxID=153919 RepID=A0AA38UD23_9AGAR|nr:hypothetical protein EV360DRAFT_87491 [Lentinula raphanica]KAJ3827723.1 hypothetical protein F5880DRAFT_1143720 [Lentinula raphanica]KAJ3837582.1 hypothetical protein F5878DRAFT_725961 [Lentinula raphanica]
MADAASCPSMPDEEAVASTLGVWITSFFLATILYGMGFLQAWLYFHWYPNDGWKLKTLVVTVVVLETVQVTTFYAATYNVLITHFGNWTNVLAIGWLHSAQLLAGYLSAFVVQMYFVCTIWLLNEPGIQRWVFTVPIVVSAVIELAMTLGQTIAITFISSFTQIGKTTWIYSLLSACTFTCDVLIALTLYLTLMGKKKSIQEIAGVQYFPSRSNAIIRKLTIYTVNRGVLTAVAAAINLILFLAIPNTFYYFVGLLTSSKLYMNSMLAALNSRQYIARVSEDEAAQCWNSIPVPALASDNTQSRATNVTSTLDYHEETSSRQSKIRIDQPQASA